MRIKSLAFAISTALFMVNSASAAQPFQKETDAYKQFVIEQIDHLEADTQKFVAALKAGNVEEAKRIYPLARMYYERSEPIAESFGELDPRIDARLADLQEDAKSNNKPSDEKSVENEWTGFHKIEKILWTENTTKGTEAVADQLLKDVKELRAKIPTTEVTAELMVTGAVDLLNEVSTSKITGEEDIFSRTDLYDFKANIEGAEKIFALLKPTIVHIPVIIASIIYGPRIGATLGFLMGMLSLTVNTLTILPTSYLFSPFVPNGNFYSVVIAIVPRILIGLTPYFVYKLLKGRAGLIFAGALGSAQVPLAPSRWSRNHAQSAGRGDWFPWSRGKSAGVEPPECPQSNHRY